MQACSQQRVWSSSSRDRHGWDTLWPLCLSLHQQGLPGLSDYLRSSRRTQTTRRKPGLSWGCFESSSHTKVRHQTGCIQQCWESWAVALWSYFASLKGNGEGAEGPWQMERGWSHLQNSYRSIQLRFLSMQQLELQVTACITVCSVVLYFYSENWHKLKGPSMDYWKLPSEVISTEPQTQGQEANNGAIRKKEIPCIIRFICLKPSGNWLFRI